LVSVYARIWAYLVTCVLYFFPHVQPIAMFKLSICSSYGWITQPQTCYWLFERKYNTCTRDEINTARLPEFQMNDVTRARRVYNIKSLTK
jgi:hypothetical protein